MSMHESTPASICVVRLPPYDCACSGALAKPNPAGGSEERLVGRTMGEEAAGGGGKRGFLWIFPSSGTLGATSGLSCVQ